MIDLSLKMYACMRTGNQLHRKNGLDGAISQIENGNDFLQDGTKSILCNKNNYINELADDTRVLIQAIKEKFSPDVFVFMEVPKIEKSTNNDSTNEKIKLFSRKMREKLKSLELEIKFRAMHYMLLNLPSYNELYYDAIHFNYQRGVPFLKTPFFLMSF